jgi:hypothetical protein
MSLGAALSKEFKASLCKVDHFAFIVLVHIRLRFDLPVGDRSDAIDDILGLTDKANQRLVFGFEKL